MTTTPYSTISQYASKSTASWVPEEHRERILAVLQYDDMYWSAPEAFQIEMADEESDPIYVPKARTVVDTTSHFLLKGLEITCKDKESPFGIFLNDFLDREEFLTRFHVAKHSGVARGDWLIHISADAAKEEGSRISINSVHPASYFPVYDDWDPEKLIRVHLAEVYERRENNTSKSYIHKLTYEYIIVSGNRRVQRTEGMFEEKDWFDPKKQNEVKKLLKTELLPEEITVIPVYHFKNGHWQGRDFGTSEIAGFERLLTAINQTISDEEVALALEGLGVYATDAQGPIDPVTNQRRAWEIAPARVMEVPTGSFFKRVEGISNVTPMLEHVKYLQDALFEASGTSDIARGMVDVQIAQSGIALALRFLPTLAKLEERDRSGISKLKQFWHDWKRWVKAFEGQDFDSEDINIVLGDKLPTDKTTTLNELNNMLDRKVISRKQYRREAIKLGYEFPDDMEKEIAAEAQEAFDQAQKLASLNQPDPSQGVGAPAQDPSKGKSNVQGRPKTPATQEKKNRSRNRNRPNESGGTEAGK